MESTACIFFHPEAYSTNSPKLMGRNAAGESFLNGFLKYSRQNEKLWAFVENNSDCNEFVKQARKIGRDEPIGVITNQSITDARYPGTIFYPGPDISSLAKKRSLFNDSLWSMCGITHTTSSLRAITAIGQWITEPVQPWDAAICTSNAVKSNVLAVLESEHERIKARLGSSRSPQPILPVIPLGIDTGLFRFTSEQRSKARTILGATENTIIILYTGRLSFHAKAHPLIMYDALERAATETGRDIHLIECGWHANEYIAESFTEAARHTCPSIKTTYLDGREKQNRDISWASADIFCSLSDNIQETFGIVPIEAMAAGLPVVVSDWDGYKDSVRHGIDGFRVPTVMAPAGHGLDIAMRHALEIDSYDMYCGHSSSITALDFTKLVKSFTTLIANKDLRLKMGAAGRERARSVYDWSQIIPKYEELWEELSHIRANRTSSAGKSLSIPAALDPTKSFSSYPTYQLSDDVLIEPIKNSYEESIAHLEKLSKLKMVAYAEFIIPNEKEIQIILRTIHSDSGVGTALGSLLSDLIASRHIQVRRGIIFLIKIGLLKLA